MSRLFEALQRSEPESVGVNFAQPEALVTELLKTAELEVPETEPGVHEFVQFPSLPISLPHWSNFSAVQFAFQVVSLPFHARWRLCFLI